MRAGHGMVTLTGSCRRAVITIIALRMLRCVCLGPATFVPPGRPSSTEVWQRARVEGCMASLVLTLLLSLFHPKCSASSLFDLHALPCASLIPFVTSKGHASVALEPTPVVTS